MDITVVNFTVCSVLFAHHNFYMCGNVDKLMRICAMVSEPLFTEDHPRLNPNVLFVVLGGFFDLVLPTAFVHAYGAITGLGNIAPVSLFPSSVPCALSLTLACA